MIACSSVPARREGGRGVEGVRGGGKMEGRERGRESKPKTTLKRRSKDGVYLE